MAEIKIIGVRAIPPFPCLRPGLDINRSQHGPVIRNKMAIDYLNLSPKCYQTIQECLFTGAAKNG